MSGEMAVNGKIQQKKTKPIGLGKALSICFPGIDFHVGDPQFRLASELVRFFSAPSGEQFVSQVKEVDGTFLLPLDFQQSRKLCEIQEFYAILESKSKDALLCMSAALRKLYFMKLGDESFDDFVKINIRLHNCPQSMIALKNLKAAYIDRLVSVRGTVVKVSTVKPLVMQMSFACTKCGTSITRDFPDGKFSPPPVCELHGCKCRTFNPIRSTARIIDFQKIRKVKRQESRTLLFVPRSSFYYKLEVSVNS